MEYTYEVREGVPPSEVASSWADMEASSATNYVRHLVPDEEFWLDIGEPSADPEMSPDLPVHECPAEMTFQPVYFGPTVLYIGGSLRSHPRVGDHIDVRVARNIVSLTNGIRRKRFKLFTDDGELFSIMTRRRGDDIQFQGFLNLSVPDHVTVDLGDCAYDAQPAGIGLTASQVADGLSEMVFESAVSFTEGSVDLQTRSTSTELQSTETMTVEGDSGSLTSAEYVVPRSDIGPDRPKYVFNDYVHSVDVLDRDGGTVTVAVEAEQSFHDWADSQDDVMVQ